jgi:hypothetical protein
MREKNQNIIFNFSKNKQFVTKLSVNSQNIELVREVKLLGTYITDDLKWKKNTKEIVKKSYKRMQLLHKAANFTSNIHDLRSIYLTYIRSVLEQSAVVWHSGLTAKNRRDLERVQKGAVRVIMKSKYTTYKEALKKLNIETLDKRRELLCLRFANNCIKNPKVKDFFPKYKNAHKMKKRREQEFVVNKAKTRRYKKSAIPFIQNLLNNESDKKKATIKEFI